MKLDELKKSYPESYAALMAAAGGHPLRSIGHGSNRAVFRVLGTSLVLKVQFGGYAELANTAERDIWRGLAGHPARKRIAPCRMLKGGVIAMRRVAVTQGYMSGPDWSWAVDGGQGGYYMGRWVLYDYGHELYRYNDDSMEHMMKRNKDWIATALESG